jgi:hypothetical protein
VEVISSGLFTDEETEPRKDLSGPGSQVEANGCHVQSSIGRHRRHL